MVRFLTLADLSDLHAAARADKFLEFMPFYSPYGKLVRCVWMWNHVFFQR